MSLYNCTTRLIKITADPVFLEDESRPEDSYYVWSYTIVIKNTGEEIVQLLNRHWKITDAYGRVQEVRGAGVVGEQPVLEPGDSFEYTSGTPLATPTGIMAGSYEMTTNSGERFDAEVPAFSLDCPYAVHNVH